MKVGVGIFRNISLEGYNLIKKEIWSIKKLVKFIVLSKTNLLHFACKQIYVGFLLWMMLYQTKIQLQLTKKWKILRRWRFGQESKLLKAYTVGRLLRAVKEKGQVT